MSAAMDYDFFVRSAFGLALGKNIERFEDPAGFADTDTFTDGNLSAVKAATGYSIGIIRNNLAIKTDAINDIYEKCLSSTVNAANVATIIKLINEFNAEVVEPYYNWVDGMLVPK